MPEFNVVDQPTTEATEEVRMLLADPKTNQADVDDHLTEAIFDEWKSQTKAQTWQEKLVLGLTLYGGTTHLADQIGWTSSKIDSYARGQSQPWNGDELAEAIDAVFEEATHLPLVLRRCPTCGLLKHNDCFRWKGTSVYADCVVCAGVLNLDWVKPRADTEKRIAPKGTNGNGPVTVSRVEMPQKTNNGKVTHAAPPPVAAIPKLPKLDPVTDQILGLLQTVQKREDALQARADGMKNFLVELRVMQNQITRVIKTLEEL